MISGIKKGLTLLELVIAMALSTIVIGGTTVIFLSMNRMSQAETKTYSELADVKNLVTVVDRAINNPSNKNVSISAPISEHLLFTVTDSNDVLIRYYFANNQLESLNVSTSATEVVYTCDNDVTISIDTVNSYYRFTFSYGSDGSNALYLLKKI